VTHVDLDPLWTAAFTDFDTNDVSVAEALRFLAPDLPHLPLLALRRARTPEAAAEARVLLTKEPSAWLREAFVAGPLSRCGRHEDALRARLELLAQVPRWEGALAAVVLTGIARDALALGDAAHATVAAERALRFSPMAPATLAVLADAQQAAGQQARAASIRAHLWDAGSGPSVIAGEPTAADREATPWSPNLTHLEPMSLEDRARFAVFSLHDQAHIETLSGVVRHAVVQLRCGHVAQAWAALYALRVWEPQASSVLRWLGLEGDSDRVDRMRALLLDVIEATPAGAAAAAAARKKAPNPADPTLVGRVRGVNEAPAETVEPALLDNYLGVRLAARVRLADHPLVTRAAAIEESMPGLFRFYGGEPPQVWGQAQVLAGLWNPDAASEPGPRPTPVKDALMKDGQDDLPGVETPHSFLEPARAAKPVCKTCKAPFTLGELQLRVRGEYDILAKAAPHHPRCATKPKLRVALAAAAARWRSDVPR